MPERDLARAVIRALTLLKCALANGPASISDDLVEIWTAVLASAGLTPADVERAAGIVASRETFFPQPVRFIQAIHPPPDEDLAADRAWAAAREAVRRFGAWASLTAADLGGDVAALWAIGQIGWERLCSELGDDNQAILRAEFVRWYRLGRADRSRLDYLVGRFEAENRLRGFELTPVGCGRPDWSTLPAGAPGRKALAGGLRALGEGE